MRATVNAATAAEASPADEAAAGRDGPGAPARSRRAALLSWMKVHRRRLIAGAAAAAVALVVVGLSSRTAQKSAPAHLREASAYLAAGQRSAALIASKNALQADPAHIEARLLHGKLVLESGDARGAEDEFRRAQELGAARETVLPLIVRSLIARKEYQQALDVAAAPPGADPANQSAELLALRGHALFLSGRMEQSREAYRAALAVDAEQPDALLGEARIAVIERNPDLALTKARESVARAPNNPDALALLADLTRLAGEEKKAAEIYEKALEIAQGSHAMRLSLVSIYVGLREYDTATRHLDYVLKAAPESPTANFLYATIEFRRQRYVEARNLAASVLRAQGNHVASLLLVGASAFMTQDYPIAEKALRRALVLVPDNVHARKMLGAALVRTQKSREALDELLPLRERFRDDADLHATIGEAYLDLKEFGPATEHLEKAAAIAPNNPQTHIKLGRTRIAAGELERAVEDLEAAQALAPRAREAKLLIAMANLRKQDYERTIAVIDGMEPAMRSNPVALNLLGAAHVGKADFKRAAKLFEQALALAPTYMPAIMNLVQIHLREKDAHAAILRLETVLKQSPNNIQAMFALASILAEIPERREEAIRWLERAQRANPESPEPLLRLARYQLGRADAGAALLSVRRALDMKIGGAEILDALGQIQLAAKAPRQALDTYVRMASEYPKSPLAHFRLGFVQQLNVNSAGARQSYRNALALRPDYVEAKVQLAQLEVRAGNTATALKLADELQKQLPKSGLGLTLRGDVLALSNRMKEATGAFHAAFALERTPALVVKLHQAYAQAGEIERGERIVADWLQQQPKDLATRQYVADYSLSARRHQIAREHYEALALAMPKNQQVLNNLAIVYDELKDERALQTAERAYRLNPRNAYVADTYGWMLVKLGRLEQGRDILGEAASHAPAIGDIRFHYAVALARSGQRKEARSELERALSLRANASYAAEARKLLEQLRN